VVLLAQASCSSCPRYYEAGTAYVIDVTCDGMTTAPPALDLPPAPPTTCNGSSAAPVAEACLENPSQCSTVGFLIETGGLRVTIRANLSPSKSPSLNVTLPDPSVTITAVLFRVPGQPGELLTTVAGELMVQIQPNHLTSVYGVGFIDAAGDQIAIQNATFEARGHVIDTCDAN
jgi:hypothetical protein